MKTFLLCSALFLAAWQAWPAEPPPAAATNEMEITCDGGFEYTSDPPKAIYRQNVHVTDPQMEMLCELLTIYFQTNYNIDLIVAETNVVIIHQEEWAVGDKAVFNATNSIMELSGNVMLDTPRGYSFCDLAIYDRKKGTIYAPGKVKMVLPGAIGTNFPGFGIRGPTTSAPGVMPATNAPGIK